MGLSAILERCTAMLVGGGMGRLCICGQMGECELIAELSDGAPEWRLHLK